MSLDMRPPLSKRAVEVVIEPLDPAVQKAVARIRAQWPGLLGNVRKIVVHPGGGNELGHVESGPQKDPQEIHLFKGRIEQQVKQQLTSPGLQPTPKDYEEALEQAIVEVVGHEAGHIGVGPMRPPEQMRTQPFLGEPEAEAKAKETVRRVFPALPRAAMELDSIRRKFAAGQPMAEPSLSFLVRVVIGDRQAMLREGLQLLRTGACASAELELDEADRFNSVVIRRRDVARLLGVASHVFGHPPYGRGFSESIAAWQGEHEIDPTGKLDDLTLAKIRASILPHADFPRNFGVVSMKPLVCRGRQPDSPEQLVALAKAGIRRILTLNDDRPEIRGWCQDAGLEHVHARLGSGRPGEEGWGVIGPSVASFLLETPVFVHCRHGADRTGGVVARFRTETGWPCDLAYYEAKAYGFKDRFPDLVDNFVSACSHDTTSHRHPPIDTAKIRSLLERFEKSMPEREQYLLEGTPSDLHYMTDASGYESGADTILEPFGIRSIPTGYPGGGR